MKFTERDIAELRKAARLKKLYSIYEAYLYIYDERLEFVYQDIIASRMSMMLPNTFIDMPKEFAKLMYPSEKRPAIIKTNPSLTENFAFTFFDGKIKMNEVITCAREFLDMLKNLYPGNRYMECSEHFMDEERQHVLAWYTFSNPTLTETLYNIHAYTNVENRLLHCIFSTNEERFDEWKPYALEAFDSIRSKTEMR